MQMLSHTKSLYKYQERISAHKIFLKLYLSSYEFEGYVNPKVSKHSHRKEKMLDSIILTGLSLIHI